MSDAIRPQAGHPGSAQIPTGDPMKDGVGAASWNPDRADRCDLTLEGEPKIQPMSVLGDSWEVHPRDPDPRGMRVVAADGVAAGEVDDIWVDRSEPAIRYLSVKLSGGQGSVLLPMGYAKVDTHRGRIKVGAIMSKHFADVPRPRASDRIALLEEDKVVAWYAGGFRYAEPSRLEPLF